MDLLDWFVRAWRTLDGVHLVMMVAGLVLFLAGAWPVLGQKKEGEVKNTTVIIHGPGQVGDHNVQNNTVNVNAPAAYATQVRVGQRQDAGVYYTDVQFSLTDGPWDASAQSAFVIKLSAPWDTYNIAGFPWGRQNVLTNENAAGGVLQYSTTTPPNARAVEFHFIGKQPMNVLELAASPHAPAAPN